MQFESLKCFCDLAETQSFTKAAQINNVTQSAVSQTVSGLEKHFKSLLIERSKKNFRLTKEGATLYEYSKRILQGYDALFSRIQELDGVISGNVRVSTVYSVGLHELPPYIKHFLRAFPGVNVRVEYRHATQVYEDVLGNVADLGLVAFPVRNAKLETVLLRKDPLVLICHPRHPFAKLRSIKITALNGQRFVSFGKEIPTQKALDKVFQQEGVTVERVMAVDNVETVKRAVEIDAGVGIVPETTIQQEVSDGTLAAVRLENRECVRQLGVIYRKDRMLTPAMKRFLELLKKPL